MNRARRAAVVCALVGAGAVSNLAAAQAARGDTAAPVVVASKPFGESFLLAEMFSQLLEARGFAVVRRPGLGATEVAFRALRTGAIDVYPEYVGTGLLAILHDSVIGDPREAFDHVSRAFDARFGIRWLPPLGFENTYAIAVRGETARRYSLRTLTDLARAAPQLVAGLTSDFIGRPDGLAGISREYGIRFRAVRPLAPALKYQALAEGGVDVIDGYSTDGLLARYDLVVLADDRRFFPPYQAAALVGPRLARERPDVIATLVLLSGRFDEARMRAFNRRVEVEHEDVAAVARDALHGVLGAADAEVAAPRMRGGDFAPGRLGPLAGRHLLLVAAAPVSASSYLLAKRLMRYDKTETIVLWQAMLVALFTLPFALYFYVLEPYFAAFGGSFSEFQRGVQELPGLKAFEAFVAQQKER